MFSKELYELDRNTVRYMIDELQEENKRQKEEIERQNKQLERMEYALADALRRLKEQKD
ncbi:MAG: hypothetical protein HFG93_09170 [Dorea sp.]|nr:hypothetical protein [Dorea sp.]